MLNKKNLMETPDKKHRLLYSTTNRILEILSHNKSIMPSELSLSKELEVSRTVIRKAFDILKDKGIIEKKGRDKQLKRTIQQDDFYLLNQEETDTENIIRQFFLSQMKSGEIRPGIKFSVLELAKASGCNRTVVREFLYKFSKFGLVEKLPRKMWGMVRIDQDFIRELTETRKMLELDALHCLWSLPKQSPVWKKIDLIRRTFIDYQDNVRLQPDKIWHLDEEFYQELIGCRSNRFISQFYSIVYFVYNLHYQWCLDDEADQAVCRLAQITSLLEKLLNKEKSECIDLLSQHFEATAKMFSEGILMLEFP